LFPGCTHQSRKEERATLTRFDNELKELERVIKEKQALSESDL
jgi:structural maintenance of chromosome 2